jgi:hypothetical protein
MPAPDGEQFKLYHGTAAWIKPGDSIVPGQRDVFYGPDAIDHQADWPRPTYPVDEHTSIGAYSTPHLDVAKKFATQAVEQQKESAGIRTVVRGGDKYEFKHPETPPYQPALFAPVYEVEHLSEHSDPHGRIAKEKSEVDRDHRRDKVGFRVNKTAGYSYHNEESS